jgi:5-methylcytosine-specific restriction endonuclease McrA
MKAIRLSHRSAQTLLDYLDGAPRAVGSVAIAELRRALEVKPRSSAVKKTAAKRASKTKETKRIRTMAVERASGRCEACGSEFSAFNPAQLDHFWGRGRAAQSIENCWLVHATCHSDKTSNRPSRAHWLFKFLSFANRYDYVEQSAKARSAAIADGFVFLSESVGCP